MRRGDHVLSSLTRRIRSPPVLTSLRPTSFPFHSSTSERKTDPQKLSYFRQSRRFQSCSLEKARQAARAASDHRDGCFFDGANGTLGCASGTRWWGGRPARERHFCIMARGRCWFWGLWRRGDWWVADSLLWALQNPVLRPKCPKQLAGQLPAASRGAVSYISQNVTALPGDMAFLQPK